MYNMWISNGDAGHVNDSLIFPATRKNSTGKHKKNIFQ